MVFCKDTIKKKMWQESLRKYNLAVFLKSVEQILYTDLCVSDYGSDSTKD